MHAGLQQLPSDDFIYSTRLVLVLVKHTELQLGQEPPNICKLQLILLQASPLAELLLITLVITHVTHGASICARTHTLGLTIGICRRGGMAFETDEGIDEGVEVGFRFGGCEDVGV